ncbi:unnamed protein product [Hymenolepis diminuta]|uniref:Uncharacterized protein n=1 Tax=Hymenolepis diminuta TaxID=6216 RepID=A0A564Y6X4_HYMDI|nr:unnamed protein product [Hymenolepis diminuta]
MSRNVMHLCSTRFEDFRHDLNIFHFHFPPNFSFLDGQLRILPMGNCDGQF